VLTYYKSDGKAYPYYLKNDLLGQIPMLRKKFLKNIDYAGKTIDEIFDASQLATAEIKKAVEFRTCLFLNKGKGVFEKKPLPAEAQFSPVYTLLAEDFDHDGTKDILLGGNLYGLKPELGRYDAAYGVFYKGLGGGKLEYVSPQRSGFFYRGQARDLVIVRDAAGAEILLLGCNDAPLHLFKNNK
jgi:hypothetical protein